MNERKYREAVKKSIQGKFRGHSAIQSKVTPRYPQTAEREMKRFVNSYMKIVSSTIKKRLPELISLYTGAVRERNGEARYDGVFDFTYGINSVSNALTYEIERKITAFGIERFLSLVGESAKRSSVYEWKRVVKQTLGKDVLSDYYDDDFFAEALRKWTTERISETHSLSDKISKGIRALFLADLASEASTMEIRRSVNKYLDDQLRRMMYWGSNSVVSLSTDCNKLIYKDSGVKRYRWSDSGDGRVRYSHRYFNGKVFSFDNPPEGFYITKSGEVRMTGRRCNPGEDYGCRCVAIPIFDYDNVDIPFVINEEESK